MDKEQELLEALRAGRREAYKELYRKQYRMVEVLVVRMGGQQEDAQDLFQEALLALIKSINRPGFVLQAKVSTLLYAIARNLWLKRKENQHSTDISPGQLENRLADADDSQALAEREALFRRLADGLNALEEDCRAVIRYAFYENRPHSEIAKLMGYTEAFVKVKKFRCLEYLRRLARG